MPRSIAAAPINPLDQFLAHEFGKNYLDQAMPRTRGLYKRAAAIGRTMRRAFEPAKFLLAGWSGAEADTKADEVLKLDPNSAAAYFIKGRAHLRLRNSRKGESPENAQKIVPGDNSDILSAGSRRWSWQWESSEHRFQQASDRSQHLHTTAHYMLGGRTFAGRRGGPGKNCCNTMPASKRAALP